MSRQLELKITTKVILELKDGVTDKEVFQEMGINGSENFDCSAMHGHIAEQQMIEHGYYNKLYHATDIVYDYEDCNFEGSADPELPNEFLLEIDPDEDPNNVIADMISDETGFCVAHYFFNEVKEKLDNVKLLK